MKGWGKQTNLLRNADTVSMRIDILRDWAEQFSSAKLTKYIDESFRTLNNPNRYKYFMQPDTVTHEKFLTFLVCLDVVCRRSGDNSYIDFAVNAMRMNTSKSWLTLYYIFSLLRVCRPKFEDIDVTASRSEIEDLLMNARNGGSEFKDCNFYDYMDIIKECLESIASGSVYKKPKGKREYSELLDENKSLKKQLKKLKKKLKQPSCEW